MATSYTHNSFGHPVGYWYCIVQEDQINSVNNTSRITVNFYVSAAHGGKHSETYNKTSNTSATIWINGQQVTYRSPATFDVRSSVPHGTNNWLASGSAIVKHNSSGDGYVSIKCHHHCGNTSPHNVYLEYTRNLTHINVIPPKVASGFSVASGTHNIGSSPAMTISQKSSGVQHVISFNYNHLTTMQYAGGLSGGTHYIQIPDNWKSQLFIGNSATVTVYCDTYDGSKLIGGTSAYLTIRNPDGGATLSLPGGTYDIGSKFQFTLKNCKSYLRYSIWCYSGKNSGWVQHSDQAYYSDGDHTITFNEIPLAFKNGVANQSTDTMYVVVYTYQNGVHVDTDTKSVTIKNNDYQLYFNDLYIRSDTYTENGKYTAGKTAPLVYYSVTSTHDIKHVEFSMTGANSNSGGWDWPGRSSTWNAQTVWNVGQISIKCTVTDTAGHTASKTITANIYEEEHRLRITSFTENSGKVYIQKAEVLGSNKFQLSVAWDNTHAITKLEYVISGMNAESHTVYNPSGKSHSWNSSIVTKLGPHSVKVTLTDTKGKTASETIYVDVLEEPASLDASIAMDSNTCVDLVKGLLYKDYSKLGVKLNISHTHTLSTIRVTINGRETSLSNFNGKASSFTHRDTQKIEKSGTVDLRVYVKDVNGVTDTATNTVDVYEIIKPPSKPQIMFEENQGIFFLSEGERVKFKGSSSRLEDYQIIYVCSSVDVCNATKFCDDNSYLHANQGQMTTNLKNNKSSSLRYYILKDFGVTNSMVTRDSNNGLVYHIHPVYPDANKIPHAVDFYALQFFKDLNPGDMLWFYVRERRMGTFDKYLYSDSYTASNIPEKDLFPVCVIPPAPKSLKIYKKEQTSDKVVIQYANPLYTGNGAYKANTTNVIDVCLIAKDANGKIYNKQGKLTDKGSNSRDGLNGKTWVHYSDRQWHNVIPNNVKQFEMMFDISVYPKGTCFSIVAFYYTDYYNHPSIYSTSNILNINKSNLKMNIQISKPKDQEVFTDPNPTFNIRVNNTNTTSSNQNSIYDEMNLASNWNKTAWTNNPIWINSPRSNSWQVPNFSKGVCYTKNQPNGEALKEPKNFIEYYYTNKKLYTDSSIYAISGMSTNSEGSFKENALVITANNNNSIVIGDIETHVLLDKGYIDFTWKQNSGKFLSIGENTIKVYTTPYVYDNDVIDYIEHQGEWISDSTFYSMPIMPYNLFGRSILKPSNRQWSEVEDDVLTIKIPYRLLKNNKTYDFKFSYYADTGFLYELPGTIETTSNLNDLCSSYMFINVKNDLGLNNLTYSEKNLLYSPAYTVASTGVNVREINNYESWWGTKISFTVPSGLTEEQKKDKYIETTIRVRGINMLKLNNFTLKSTDGTHDIDLNKGSLDSTVKENMQTLTLLREANLQVDLNYIDPLSYLDMYDLREILKSIARVYKLDVTPKWRPLVPYQSYIQARDFNDTKQFCIDLFTAVKNKRPSSFTGNIELFKNLPNIKPEELRGPNTRKANDNRHVHYFPEWDDLIDAIKQQIK